MVFFRLGLRTAGSGLGQSERREGGGGRPALGELGDDGGREGWWQRRLTPDAVNVGQGAERTPSRVLQKGLGGAVRLVNRALLPPSS